MTRYGAIFAAAKIDELLEEIVLLSWNGFNGYKNKNMHNMKYLWYWLLPLVVWQGCKSSQKVSYAPEELVPKDHSVLWKISGNGLKKPSYLYGTIHIIPREDFKLSDATLRAFEDSKRIAYEIDLKVMMNLKSQFSLMSKSFMAGGKTLKNLLSPEDYAFVHSKLEKKGLPPTMLERMKPMFISTMIGGGEEAPDLSGNGDMTSVELELHKMAKRRKMESTGLETAEYQMAVFDSIPYEVQANMLVQSLRAEGENPEGESEMAKMIKMYKDQDISAMQSMIGNESDGLGKYEDLLLGRRNRNWIPVMGRLMREKSTFFAVGAGHLGGPEGVIALLRKEGYRVENGHSGKP